LARRCLKISERETIAKRQGLSENRNFEEMPTPPKTDSSGCFGIGSYLDKKSPEEKERSSGQRIGKTGLDDFWLAVEIVLLVAHDIIDVNDPRCAFAVRF